MIKALGVPKVESRARRLYFIVSLSSDNDLAHHTCVEHGLESLDMSHRSRLSVDTLHIKAVHIYRLDTLMDYHWHS